MNKSLMLVLLFLIPGTLMAQQPAANQAPQASVTPLTALFTHPLNVGGGVLASALLIAQDAAY